MQTLSGLEVIPQPGGQTAFLACPAFEALFGGVAGPGKSWALVIDAPGLQFKQTALGKAAIEFAEYRAVLFRRESTQFTKLLDEGKKYYPLLGASFTNQRKGDPGPCFDFPSGAKIFICHMELESDKENHQGQEYQYVGFDELTQFTITQYLYIFSRTRSKIPGLFGRIRSTANPVGENVVWVKKRFITNLKAEETNYFLSDGDPAINPQGRKVPAGTPDALSRTFIPGRLSENKYSDPNYPAQIKAMGSQMEKALLLGDWDAFGGDMFPDFNYSTMVIPPFAIPKEWRLTASIDPGESSPCSFSMRATDPSGNVYRLFTYYERERAATAHAVAIKQAIKEFKHTLGRMPEQIVAGLDAFAKKDRYAVIAHGITFADVFQSEGLLLQPATTDRIQGWWAMRNLMQRKQYFVFDTFNTPFLEELIGAVRDEKRPEDLKGRGNDPAIPDHALDEDRYGVMAIYKPATKKEADGWAAVLSKKAKRQSGWKVGQG